MNSSNHLIVLIAAAIVPVLFSITAHEAAHAWVARKLGDNTAAMLGRVTLNPIKHIDPIGTIAIPLVLALLTQGSFLFGYAKPVPVRIDRLKNPRSGMVWVALAGPLCNLVQALIWNVLGYLLVMLGIPEPFFLLMCIAGMTVNLVMFAFNLFPILPLDGGRVLAGLLPFRAALAFSRLEPYGFFIVMALMLLPVPGMTESTGIIWPIWMAPLTSIGKIVISIIPSPLLALLPL